MSSSQKSSIPSEMRINKQWDFAIEQFVSKVSIGALSAGLASIVLFRKYNIDKPNYFINKQNYIINLT
jgi:hypothetical protein